MSSIVLSNWFEFLMTAVIIPAGGAIIWGLLRKWGIQKSDSHREAYTAAAQRVAGELFVAIRAGKLDLAAILRAAAGVTVPDLSHPAMRSAVETVMTKAAPDAVKHFGLDVKPDEIGHKIMGMLGPMLANASNMPMAKPPAAHKE